MITHSAAGKLFHKAGEVEVKDLLPSVERIVSRETSNNRILFECKGMNYKYFRRFKILHSFIFKHFFGLKLT